MRMSLLGVVVLGIVVLAYLAAAPPSVAQVTPAPDPETSTDQEHGSDIPIDLLIGDWTLHGGLQDCKLALFRDELSDGTMVVVPGDRGCALPISRWSLDGNVLLLMNASDETLLSLTETDDNSWSSGEEDMSSYTLTR
jgi:hypothetical protein